MWRLMTHFVHVENMYALCILLCMGMICTLALATLTKCHDQGPSFDISLPKWMT